MGIFVPSLVRCAVLDSRSVLDVEDPSSQLSLEINRDIQSLRPLRFRVLHSRVPKTNVMYLQLSGYR
jgi:hypothetical protein